MTLAPRVSVITIFRDGERYLEQAIASVRAQTLAGWELLLVDDGSTDGSSALARAHAARDPQRIRYLEHPARANLGMSASRNLGLAEARAPYVAFLDADDVYLPRRLERHAALLDAEPSVALVQSESVYWMAPRAADDAAAELRLPRGTWPDGTLVEPPQALVALLALPSFAVPICDLTVRRRVALELGGFEAEFRGLCEDRVFLTKLYFGQQVLICGEFLAKVRCHDASCTHSTQLSAHRADGAYQRGIGAFQRWTARYLRAHGVSDPTLLELAARWAGAGTSARGRGRFMMLRTLAFGWLERHAPRPVYHALVSAYHRAVRRYTLWCFQRLQAEARRRDGAGPS